MRIAFNSSRWAPEGEDDGAEFQYLLSCVQEDEAEQVRRFRFFEDKQRALVSRLLQRKCAETCLGLGWDEILIKRTKGKKPFVASGVSERPEGAPNFNYNVSHEGDYVVLASEPVCLVGVDVAAPGQSRKGGGPFDLDRVLKSFGSAFTRDELRNIECFGDPAAQDGAFRRNWSCKEAFTKARGDGVGFELKRCEFTIEEAREGLLPYTHTAEVSVDGNLLPGWSFLLQPLGDHWVTVARGPCSDVVDAHGEFTKTLSRRNLDPCGWRREAGAPRSGFEVVGVRDLLPADKLEGYDEIVEEDPFG